MTAFNTLIMLASGIQPPCGLLHNCRFEGFGSESYGIEAIVARLLTQPAGGTKPLDDRLGLAEHAGAVAHQASSLCQ